MKSDHDLLRAWKKGDEMAGDALVTRHFAALYRFLHTKIEAESEDLVQQVFLVCLQRPPADDTVSFRAYLFGIARNVVRERQRKQARGARALDRMPKPSPPFGSPSWALGHADARDRLHQVLRRLPLDLQIVLELHYWEELPLQDIAHVIEVPEGTIKSRLFRARGLLRRELEQEPSLQRSRTNSSLGTWVRRVRRALGRSTPQAG